MIALMCAAGRKVRSASPQVDRAPVVQRQEWVESCHQHSDSVSIAVTN